MSDGIGGASPSTRWPTPEDPRWRPVFTAPDVQAIMSTRRGGVSQSPFDSFNLRPDIGDDPAHVAENRKRWGKPTRCRGLAPVKE